MKEKPKPKPDEIEELPDAWNGGKGYAHPEVVDAYERARCLAAEPEAAARILHRCTSPAAR
jgi:hypothetical protein